MSKLRKPKSIEDTMQAVPCLHGRVDVLYALCLLLSAAVIYLLIGELSWCAV